MTGFPSYLFHVRSPGSSVVARQGSWSRPFPPVYSSVGMPSSSTAQPDQQPSRSGPSGDGESATGSSDHVTRSSLTAWPQWMVLWYGPPGLYW